MPINAKEFLHRSIGPLNEQVEDLNKRADAAANFAVLRSERKFTIAVNNASHDACEACMASWRREGWTVKRVTDTRDGDYLEFSV